MPQNTTTTVPILYEVEGRARNGDTGFEAVLFTPGDPVPGNGSTQLNPAGTPAWSDGSQHNFKMTYDVLSGTSTWSIDFNQDGDFMDNEENATSNSISLIGKSFKLINLVLRGGAGGETASVLDFTINGINHGHFNSTGDTDVTQLFDDPQTFGDILITGSLLFSNLGGTDERPRVWVQLGESEELACVTTRVWDDLDGDGRQDGNESDANISGVKVNLLHANTNSILTWRYTDASGNAKIPAPPGTYKLEYILPVDHKFTHRGTPITSTNNSDAYNHGSHKGKTGSFTLSGVGTNIEYVDAGMWSPGIVKARVWDDLDGDGKQDGNESGSNIGGVTVNLLDADNADQYIKSSVTNSDGIAEITGVPADRRLRLQFVLPAGHKFTAKTNQITSGNNSDAYTSGSRMGKTGTFSMNKGSETVEYVDAGMWKPGTVIARVWDDLDGDGKQDGNESNSNISGVTVNLLDANNNDQFLGSAVTNINGLAEITNVPADRKVRLEFVLPLDHSFTQKINSLTSRNNSDARTHGTSIGKTSSFSMNEGSETVEYVDAGMWTPGTVVARVWDDLDGDGKQDGNESGSNLEGITVKVLDADNSDQVLGTSLTGANGLAEITDVPADRRLRLDFVLPDGHKFTRKSGSITLTKNSDARSSGTNKGKTGSFSMNEGSETVEYVDAGMWKPGTIIARVWDDLDGDGKQDGNENGSNIEGITVKLLDADNNNQILASSLTGANGLAEITDAPADRRLRLEFVLPDGHKFTRKSGSITLTKNSDARSSGTNKGKTGTFYMNAGSETVKYVDAGMWRPGTVITRVWDDMDGDGKQDGNESGANIDGVTVKLLDADNGGQVLGSTLTGSNGLAEITNVPADRRLRLEFVLPNGHKFTKKIGSITTTNNSDVSTSGSNSGKTGRFYMRKGSETVKYVDAGMWMPATVIARVWNDLDGDGKQDGNESGANFGGVTVKLLDANDNNNVLQTTVSGSDGIAEFIDVPSDRYLRLEFSGSGIVFTNRNGNITVTNNSDASKHTGKTSTFRAVEGSEEISYVDAGLTSGPILPVRETRGVKGNSIISTDRKIAESADDTGVIVEENSVESDNDRVDMETIGNESLQTQIDALMLYPVPARTNLNVLITARENSSASYLIYNLSGELVKIESLGLNKGENRFNIGISNLPAGNYIFHLSSDNYILQKNFQIVK
jgi:uncharacterized protein (DUF2141 family)